MPYCSGVIRTIVKVASIQGKIHKFDLVKKEMVFRDKNNFLALDFMNDANIIEKLLGDKGKLM